jgi:hypothetical protein
VPTFTADWFSRHIPLWQKHVVPRLAGHPCAHWLEVGSFEGRSALWALDNFLLGSCSTISCIDTWEPIVPGEGSDFEATFNANVADRPKVHKYKARSSAILPALPLNYYHGAYIDGSHEKGDVLQDVEFVLPLLRSHALLIFDDYDTRQWGELLKPQSAASKFSGVRQAADLFLSRHGGEFEVLYAGYQLFLRRTS